MKTDTQPPIRLVFEYKTKQYEITLRDKITFVNWDDDLNDWSWFWWEQGNGACDCNRSSFIRERYPEFPELDCNDEIELVDWEIIS